MKSHFGWIDKRNPIITWLHDGIQRTFGAGKHDYGFKVDASMYRKLKVTASQFSVEKKKD